MRSPSACGASTARGRRGCRSPTAARARPRCSQRVARRRLAVTPPSADPLGRPVDGALAACLPDGTAVVECAEAVGLPRLRADELDPLRASSRGLGELLLAVARDAGRVALLVCVGGTATVDGGAGMRAVVGGWLEGVPIRVACDVRNPLLGERGAARVFGPQKGADAAAVERARSAAGRDRRSCAPFRDLPGAGAGGGLGAALRGARRRAARRRRARARPDRLRRARCAARRVVVTGEGTVDATTLEGKAPGAVRRRCERLGVRCELFGGVVRDGIEAHALSGRRAPSVKTSCSSARSSRELSPAVRESSSILPRTPSSFAAQIR